jgi:hypothetical protein
MGSATVSLDDHQFCDDFLEEDTQQDINDEYSAEQERELLFFATGFSGEVKYIAKEYIFSFFSDKNFFCGGRIPKRILLDNSHVLMVIEYDISRSVQKAYDCLKEHSISKEFLGEVTGDIRLVSSILNDLSISRVPQQFAGGMLLLYLKLVEGIEIG